MRIRDANVLRDMLEECLRTLDKSQGREESALAQCITVIINAIDDLPEIEVEPVRRERWLGWHGDKRCKDGEYRHFHYYECSGCHCLTAVKSNYCSRCGARMKGVADDVDAER